MMTIILPRQFYVLNPCSVVCPGIWVFDSMFRLLGTVDEDIFFAAGQAGAFCGYDGPGGFSLYLRQIAPRKQKEILKKVGFKIEEI